MLENELRDKVTGPQLTEGPEPEKKCSGISDSCVHATPLYEPLHPRSLVVVAAAIAPLRRAHPLTDASSPPAQVAEGHEGKRKTEALWPIHQINWQRSRYVFDMHFKYHKISKEVRAGGSLRAPLSTKEATVARQLTHCPSIALFLGGYACG